MSKGLKAIPMPPLAGSVLDRLRTARIPAPPRTLSLPSLASRSIAMSLEGTTLRVLVSRRAEIESWVSVPLGERICRGGLILDPGGLGAQIDAIRERYDLPAGRVSWSLSGHQVTTRVFDIPSLSGKALRQAVEEEAERVLGASPGENFLYAKRLEGRIRGRGVFVVVVPKTAVLTALEALESAGLRPWTMDVRALALIRAIGRPDAVVVNLEEGGLELAVVDRGVPALLRGIPLPIGLDLAAAQDRLVDETERLLSYYDDLNPDRPLDPAVPLYLTGSLATGIGLAERVRAITRHPIGRPSTRLTHPANFPLGDYLVNLGLALKQA